MKTQRIAAVAMIAIEVAVVEHMVFLYEWYPVAIVLLAVIGMRGFIALPFGRRAQILGAIALGVFIYAGMYTNLLTFVVAHRLPLDPLLGGNALVIAWYLMTLQCALLFLRMPETGLPVYFPVMGVFVMVCAGAVGRHGSLDPWYHAAALAMVPILIVFMRGEKAARPSANDRRGAIIQAGIVGLSLTVSFGFSGAMGSYRAEIDKAVFSFLPGMRESGATGFSTRAHLDTITHARDTGADSVALRVFSKNAPGYLRGRAYDRYSQNSWDISVPERLLKPLQDVPPEIVADAGARAYRLHDGSGDGARRLDVVPNMNAEGCLFAPLEAQMIVIQGNAPALDEDGNLKVAGTRILEYAEYASPEPARGTLDEAARQRLLALPDSLDPRIRDLAARLFANEATTRDKIQAVVDYFAKHYTYRMGIDIPEGQDPLAYFLIDQPPAHCEYFATGAAVLLRLGGVPCRYVTGFVTTEYNGVGRYWIARNKDAHAWVEAFDAHTGAWTTVEATVAGGLPGQQAKSWTAALTHVADSMRYLIRRLAQAISAGDWRSLLQGLLSLLKNAAGAPIVLSAALFIAGWMVYGRRRRRQRRQPPKPVSPHIAALTKLRTRVDRSVRRYGFTRRPEETVLAFADRIDLSLNPCAEELTANRLRQAADWYRAYSAARFGGALSEKTARELEVRWRNGHGTR